MILVRQERDSGLLSLIRSLPGGRLKTAIAKLAAFAASLLVDRKSTRLNSSHIEESRMPSSA